MEYIFSFIKENSLYKVDLPLPLEYKPYVLDLLRMISIHSIVNLMFFLIDPEKNKLLSTTYLTTLAFILFGVSFYWLILKKLVTFKFKDEEKKDN